jgi:hypothetical protein
MDDDDDNFEFQYGDGEYLIKDSLEVEPEAPYLMREFV